MEGVHHPGRLFVQNVLDLIADLGELLSLRADELPPGWVPDFLYQLGD
jgi:hypothetical protein